MNDFRPLRVAIDITPTVGQGYGVGRYVEDLIQGLPPRSVQGVYQGHHGIPPARLKQRLGGVHRYDLAGGRVGAWLRLPWILRSCSARLYHSTSTIGIPGPGWDGKVITTVMDCYPLVDGAQVTDRHRRLFRFLFRQASERSAMILVPSRHTADEVRRFGYQGPIRIIPLAVQPVPTAPRPVDAPPAYLLTMGAIEPRKGLGELAIQFQASGGPPLPWIHLGGVRHDPDGALRAAMVTGGCQWRSWVPEAERQAWLQHAAVLVCPSLYEGFSYAPLEAMASGVPVLATPGGAQQEVLPPLAPATEGVHLVEILRQMLANPDACEFRRILGRDHALSFSVDRMCAETWSAYREVMGE
jgi:glycosyltransferase involved in cell wall biosynthesis